MAGQLRLVANLCRLSAQVAAQPTHAAERPGAPHGSRARPWCALETLDATRRRQSQRLR
jgi:hypothetical protein